MRQSRDLSLSSVRIELLREPDSCAARGPGRSSHDASVSEGLQAPPAQLLVMSNAAFRGYRTISQHLNDLKKENFSLKLRIYFLEEKIQQKFEESSDDVHRRVSGKLHLFTCTALCLSLWCRAAETPPPP